MSETDLGQVWTRSLDDLSDLNIEPHQRAWLRLTRPLGLVENTALIATPNEFVKEQLETRLRALITHALSRELGRSIQLAVTVDPAATATSPAPPREAAAPPDTGPVPPGGGQSADVAHPVPPDGPVIIPMPREADHPGPAGQHGGIGNGPPAADQVPAYGPKAADQVPGHGPAPGTGPADRPQPPPAGLPAPGLTSSTRSRRSSSDRATASRTPPR